MLRDPSHPAENLANSITHDVSARYMDKVFSKGGYDIATDPLHNCILSLRDNKASGPTRGEVADIRLLGRGVNFYDVQIYKIAHIMGIHFRAGESVHAKRCGSVITCVLQGRSYYGWVKRFLKIRGDSAPGFASVRWFSRPVYPHNNFLVVRVGSDGSLVEQRFGSVVSITRIEPSRVIVESPLGPVMRDYYMMRDSGYDKF